MWKRNSPPHHHHHHNKVNYRVKTRWNSFKALRCFLLESTGSSGWWKLVPNISTFIEWWCMGNNLKAIRADNLAFNRCEEGEEGGCKWSQIKEKMSSSVKAAVTQRCRKLLSSEMNLLNNLCLMGLSIIFHFCSITVSLTSLLRNRALFVHHFIPLYPNFALESTRGFQNAVRYVTSACLWLNLM